LRDRIDAFQTVVGNLQRRFGNSPHFHQTGGGDECRSKKRAFCWGEFDRILDAPPPIPALDEMVAMDVESDLQKSAPTSRKLLSVS
jgi:hypothetical protein